jgi:phosphatidylglycerophosphate synthase
MPRSHKSKYSTDEMYIYKTLDSIIPYLCKSKIHPNVITLSTIPQMYFLYHSMVNHEYLTSLLFIILIRITDCLDGMVARQCNLKSKLGSYLDTGIDILSFTTFILGFIGSIKTQYITCSVSLLVLSIMTIIVISQINPENHHIDNKFVSFCEQNSVLFGMIMWFVWVIYNYLYIL